MNKSDKLSVLFMLIEFELSLEQILIAHSIKLRELFTDLGSSVRHSLRNNQMTNLMGIHLESCLGRYGCKATGGVVIN